MKYNRQNLAYKKDFSNVNLRRSGFKVVKSKSVNVLGLAPFKAIMLLLFLVAMVSYLIYSNVELDEIGGEIVHYKKNYETLLNEKIRLEVSMESKISLKNIEERAKQEGLQPVQDYQIEYVNFKTKDKFEVANNKKSKFKTVKKFLHNMLAYIK